MACCGRPWPQQPDDGRQFFCRHQPDRDDQISEALHYQSIVEISAALKAGKLSAVDLLEAMLERIAALEPKLHTYLLVTAEAARAEAKMAAAEIASGRYRGPLHGFRLRSRI